MIFTVLQLFCDGFATDLGLFDEQIDAEKLADGTEVLGAEAFVARQARLEAERTKKIEAKKIEQKTEDFDKEATFQPVISSGSLKLLGASGDGPKGERSGGVTERLHEDQGKRVERLEAKTKLRNEQENPTFSPQISRGSAMMAGNRSGNRSGNVYERNHGWAVARQLKQQMFLKEEVREK